jgi:hypothetical protein
MSESKRVARGGVVLLALLAAACGSDPARDAAFEAESTDAAASAADPLQDTGSGPLAVPEERHCVVDQSGKEDCFASFRTALAYATEGATPEAIRARGDEALAALVGSLQIGADDLPSGSVLAKASIVRGILYEHADYRGNSWIIKSDGCPGTATKLQFKQGAYWNDRISSVRLYAGCAVHFYEDYVCGGATVGPFERDTSYLGRAMNDQASCVIFF